MAQYCPRCGNKNTDEVKFCTSCGAPLGPVSGHQGTQRAAVPDASPAGSSLKGKILAIAGVVIIVIIAALVLLNARGTIALFPGAGHDVTPAATPLLVMTTAPVSGPAILTPGPATTPQTSMETPVPAITSPSPTKAVTCPSDRRACGASCTDIMNDPGNCGDCGLSCLPNEVCQMGHCLDECKSGESSCFDGCHNLSTDAGNCGTCGNICPYGLVCNQSVCSPQITTAVPTYAG